MNLSPPSLTIAVSPWNEVYDPMRQWKFSQTEGPYLDNTMVDGQTVINSLNEMGHRVIALDRRPPVDPCGIQPDLFFGVGAGHPIDMNFSNSGRLKMGCETEYPVVWIGPTILTSYPSHAYYRTFARGLTGEIQLLKPCDSVPPHTHEIDKRANCVRQNVEAAIDWYISLNIARTRGQYTRNPTAKFDLFFCYNSSDKEVVEKIYAEVVAQGKSCFIDSKDVSPGARHQKAIADAIKQSDQILVFLSSNGVGPWQEEEVMEAVRIAVKSGKKIVPVLLKGADVEELPFTLSSRSWIDLRSGIPANFVERL